MVDTTERMATKDQKQYIYRLADYNTDIKEEWVQWATDDNDKISCNDLTYAEADKLIKQVLGKNNPKPQVHPYGAFDFKNPRHRKILSLCILYDWKKTHPKTGKDIADINRLGNWLENDERAPVRKPLKKMDDIELSKIVKALTQMIKKKYK